MELKKGNVQDIIEANAERINLLMFKKDYSNQIFNKTKIDSANIFKCNFIKSSFYGNEYNDCDFVGCDFSNANMLNVKFNNCRFHECKFIETKLEDIIFNNCIITLCNFKDTKLSSNIVGLCDKDLDVIHEQNDDTMIDLVELKQLGFNKIEEYSYEITSEDMLMSLNATKDEESGPYTWRVMVMFKEDSILSDTFDIEEDIDLSRISLVIKNVLINANKKVYLNSIELSDEDKVLFEKDFKEIKAKFKQYFSPDEI